MKKNSFVLFLLTFIFYPNIIFAMKISEIMYDVAGTDTGREWIEVFNDSSNPVNFSDWKLLENAVGHILKLSKGDEIIPAGGYAVVADNDQNFLIDNPNFTGTLFDSVFGLTNTGETISLVDSSGAIIDQVGYSDSLGAKGDGNSLQLYEGVFVASVATPGIKNNIKTNSINNSPSTATTTSSNSVEISSHASPVPISKEITKQEFAVNIGRDRTSSIKTFLEFKAEIEDKFRSKSIKYLWNLGDGNQKKGKNIEHFYKHPGLYNVVLNASAQGDNAVSRALINVFKPEIKTEVMTDWFVLSNLSQNELNIGGWKLKSEDKSINFVFPQDTIISGNNKVIFDKELFTKKSQNLDLTQKNLKLYFSNGDIINE